MSPSIKSTCDKFVKNLSECNYVIVYNRNHLFGLGTDAKTETESWTKLSADTETNRNHTILNWKVLYQEVCKNSSCHVNYQNIYSVYHSVIEQWKIIRRDHL